MVRVEQINLSGKCYRRYTHDNESKDYTVRDVRGNWRFLEPRRSDKIIARVDAALDNPQTSS